MMQRVIFLDIDGVLAPIRRWDRYGDLDPVCIQVLNEIVARGGADVVVSSTWRFARTVTQMQAMRSAAASSSTIMPTWVRCGLTSSRLIRPTGSSPATWLGPSPF